MVSARLQRDDGLLGDGPGIQADFKARNGKFSGFDAQQDRLLSIAR
jgi:hypothetical protein